jgi:hypothetical protein
MIRERLRSAGVLGASLALFTALLGLQAVATLPAAAQGGTPTWTEATPADVPSGFINPSMAFDSGTGQLVLVGSVSTDASEETWIWDGANWQQVFPDASPPAVVSASLAYDSATNQLLIFGGQAWSDGSLVSNAWSWDGSSWQDVTPASGNPQGRVQASMAFDANSNQMILFGGLGGNGSTQLADTWDWNGSAWTALNPGTVPTARYSASMAYDSDSDQLIMYSGSGYADTYNWDGSNWDQLSPMNTPAAEHGAAMAYDGDTGTLIYQGGQQTEGYNVTNTFDWDGSNFNFLSPPNAPEALSYQAMAYDPNTTQMVMFGGLNEDSDYSSDTWIYAPPAPSSTCTPFSDSFSDEGLSSDWETETPLTASVASGLGYTDEQPQLGFNGESMDMQGVSGADQFTAIQSVTACTGPLSFSADVEGNASYGSAFVIDLISGDQSQEISVDGNLNSNDASDYGIRASTQSPSGTYSANVYPEPVLDQSYEVTVSVDQSGDGSVSVSPEGQPGTTEPLGLVGTGPYYVLLGQSEGNETDTGANEATWSGADLTVQPAITAALSTASPTVDGVESVPSSSLPASGLSSSSSNGAGNAASAPLSSIPLSSIGLASSPLHSIPLSSIPLSSIALPPSGTEGSGITAAEQTIQSTVLSDISVTYPEGCSAGGGDPCTGWQGILAGTDLANLPLESVTLEQVLEDSTAAANLDTVDVGALDLASSPLSSIPLSSIELGSTPLSSIGIGATSVGSEAIGEWCTELADVGSSCADFGINSGDSTTSVTVLTLALAGVPLHSIPLSSIPLSSIDLSSSPLHSIPLSSINLVSNPLSSIPLSSIPLSSIPLHSIPLSSIGDLPAVVDCDTYADCANGTLGDAADAGAILPTATVGDLGTYGTTTVGQLLDGDTTDTPDYPDLDLGDLVLSTIPPATYQWQSVDLANLPLAADESAGGAVSYTVSLDVSGQPTAAGVTVDLPASFSYVPGSSELDSSAIADPVVGSSLEWSLPVMSVGAHSLTFEANAGTGLGPASANVSVTIGAATVSTSEASVDVVDGEEPAIDNPSTAVALVPGVLDSSETSQGDLELGYLTSPGDLNDWSVNVAQGAELSLSLTNLPATYDLELFGPSPAQLQGTPSQNLGGVTDTLPSLASGTTSEGTPGSQDIPVTPPAGDVVEAVSNNPDSQSQYIQTTPLTAGTYTVQVSGYNGAYNTQPYLLQANLIGGETSPSCPSGISFLGSLPSVNPSSGPVTIPNGANTLFLADTQRLTAAYGDASESQIMSDLDQVASDSSAGVNGAVVPVDSYSSVQDAYAAWNANPCSVDAANAVVSAISSVVDQIRSENPSIQNLVIVGADDQIPFARVADGATESNERDYGSSTFPGENNPESDSLQLGYYMSDDPYAADNPLGVGSATLYLPQLAVGRLVESPTEIESALTRYVSSGGDLDATASLTTGYSFLTSGAQAVSANLASDGLQASNLINETWQESDLDSALAASPLPGVDSINAHFDFSRALPAYDNTNGTGSDLFTTEDVRDPPDPTSYAGRLLFSMGCHAGLDIDDDEVSTSGLQTPVDDWAKTFADTGALWVANTGYGYADTDTIAYSAKLMSEFAGELNGSLTIGEALTEAKQQYAAGNAIISPYDLKALMESTLYGLPMYHLNTSGTPVTPPNGPSTYSDPATGLTAANVSLNFTKGSSPGQLTLESTANGKYYQVNPPAGAAPGIQQTEYRPIEPLATVGVTESGLVAHGALITALTSKDTADFNPAYSMPAAGSADSTPPTIGNAAFPGTLQRVATYGTFTTTGTGQGAQLDFMDGQFFPNSSGSGTNAGTGTQRIFNSMSAKVFYDPAGSQLADDYTPATIATSNAYTTGTTANFTVTTTPSAPGDVVSEVVVLYTDADNPSAWSEATLSSSDGLNWSGTASVSSGENVQYIVEAVDDAGNVAVSDNEGADFNASSAPAVTVALSGSPIVNGYYTGPVTVNVTAPSGSTYVLDGASPVGIPSNGQIQVSAAGQHDITVTDHSGDTASQSFAISTSQSETSLVSYDNPALVGEDFDVGATVSAASSGAGSPTGSVEFLDDGVPVASCGGSGGEGLDSGEAFCLFDYSNPGTHQITAVYSGDSSFSGSDSSVLSQDVIALDTTTTLTSSKNPSAVGKSVKFKAKVASSTPGYGTPNGNVEFLNGTTPVAACGGVNGESLAGSGLATCTVTLAKAGVYPVTAIYLGSDAFVESTSSVFSEIVTRSACKSFTHCNLSGLDLAGANLSGLNLTGANLQHADLVGANLTGADAASADFNYANLTGATAVSVDMSHAKLIHANLTRANFSDANLSYADLRGANLTGTNLTGANKKGATL